MSLTTGITTRALQDGWRRRGAPATAAVGGTTAGMWALEGIDTLTGHRLDALGITSWDLGDLWSLATAPLVHVGWAHLVANTVPFLVLGLLIAVGSLRRWLAVAAITAVTSGLAAFVLNPPHVNTLGASGVVFGFLTYLIGRGAFSRHWGQIALGVVVAMVYGTILWGVLPTQSGVSWQGHLGGALGGILAAWLLHRGERRRTRPVV